MLLGGSSDVLADKDHPGYHRRGVTHIISSFGAPFKSHTTFTPPEIRVKEVPQDCIEGYAADACSCAAYPDVADMMSVPLECPDPASCIQRVIVGNLEVK